MSISNIYVRESADLFAAFQLKGRVELSSIQKLYSKILYVGYHG